jgi:hypothetical protein
MRFDHWILVLGFVCGCRDKSVATQSMVAAVPAPSVPVAREPAPAPMAKAASKAEARPTEFLGIAIARATRADLRRALTEKGAALKSSQGSFDVYDSRRLLDESKELELGYTSDGHFARAKYTFPSFMDSPQVGRVASLVKQKYGAPGESSGDVALGHVSFRWLLEDGVLVIVHRGWPKTTTFLEYIHPVHAPRLEEELSQGRAREHRDAFRRQADAL